MHDLSLATIASIAAIFFAAGIVKGVLGMGLPTLAMGLLGLLMTVPQAAALLTWPSLVTNLWQAFAGGGLRRLLPRLWLLQAGIAVGVAAAGWLPPQDDRLAQRLLGACLLAYGAMGIAGWRPPPLAADRERWMAPVVGTMTGLVTGITGVFVLPAVPYLQSMQLDRHQLAQALGWSFTTSTLALAALLAARGQLGMAGSLQSMLGLVPALAGMSAGQAIRRRMDEVQFRRCFFWSLAILGGWLLAR